MKRRDFMRNAGWATMALGAGLMRQATAETARRPNIVWILSEDNSIHYLRHFFPTGAPAPHIEGMAEHGITFTRAFSNAPVCSVARTTLMTGMCAPRVGTQYHRKMALAQLPGDLRMFPAYLREAGYYTANNNKKDYNAEEGDSVWDESSNKASWRKRPTPDTPFFYMESTPLSHESSLHFSKQVMESQATKTDPQSVALAPYHPDTPTFRYTVARYHDRHQAVDELVGKRLAELEADGLLEDTFVFYFGDHGGVLPRSKGYLYESGLHLPLVVRVPEKFKHRIPHAMGARTSGFVSFIDFGPTVLNLAGIQPPAVVDGHPFLGSKAADQYLEKSDEAFAYADRFDEKYDLCRSLRKGKYKYLRNYQAFYPDALRNNYRCNMLAWQEWEKLYGEGKLNATQRAFFEPKPVEALYDVEADPYEVNNLAGSGQDEVLADMRKRLTDKLTSLPDLSFFPEPYLIDNALEDGVAFGQQHKAEIARLIAIADLSLQPFDKARGSLAEALQAESPWERYWALIVCSCFGKAAEAFAPRARRLTEDSNRLVQTRAAEFLAIIGAADPRPVLFAALNTTDSAPEALLILNTIVYVRDHLKGYSIDPKELKPKAVNAEVKRRLEYLNA